MFANAGYETFVGRAPAQIIGISIRELLGQQLFAKNESMINAALRGEPGKCERAITKFDGSVSHVWTQYVPDLQGPRSTQGHK